MPLFSNQSLTIKVHHGITTFFCFLLATSSKGWWACYRLDLEYWPNWLSDFDRPITYFDLFFRKPCFLPKQRKIISEVLILKAIDWSLKTLVLIDREKKTSSSFVVGKNYVIYINMFLLVSSPFVHVAHSTDLLTLSTVFFFKKDFYYGKY